MAATRSRHGDDSVNRLRDALCSKAAVRVFLPSRDRAGRPLPPRRLYAALENTLLAIAGGATTTSGFGVWLNDEGAILREPVLIVETYLPEDVSTELRQQLASFLSALPDMLCQETLAVAIDSRLMLIKSTSHVVAGEDGPHAPIAGAERRPFEEA